MKSYKIDINSLLLDYNKGMSVKELANKYKTTYQTICYRLRTNGIKIEKRNRKKQISEDLSGIKIGKLTALEKIKSRGRFYYKCICECNNTVIIRSDNFKTNKNNHCGCGYFKGYGQISFSFFTKIKKNALCHGRIFDIDIKYLDSIFQKQNGKCAYTNIEITLPRTSRESSTTTASLDRIDSSKGYIEGNVQWVHKRINIMKMELVEKDFIFWCNLVSEGPKSI